MAVSAIVTGRIHFLPEIGKNILSQTGGRLAIALHQPQPLGIPLTDQLHILRIRPFQFLLLQKELIDHHILWGK